MCWGSEPIEKASSSDDAAAKKATKAKGNKPKSRKAVTV
jgi:hypothetical protein